MLKNRGVDNINEDTEVPLPLVTSDILKRVLQWAKYHKDNDDTKTEHTSVISAWDADFLKVDHKILFELISAANFLDIPGSIVLTFTTIARMMKGKTSEQINETFRIKSDTSFARVGECKMAVAEGGGEQTDQPKTYLDELNDDCLIGMFERLGEDDWIQLCAYNDRFRSLVVNHVITTKLFDFGNLSNREVNNKTAFELFGKTLRKIRVFGNFIQQANTTPQHTSLDEFLELVKTHCTEDNITDLSMDFVVNFSRHTERLLLTLVLFFRCVTSLSVRALADHSRDEDCVKFVKMLPLNNIRSLCVNDAVPIDFDWLRTIPTGILHHLRVGYFTNVANADAFFESQPHLKTFFCRDQSAAYLESIAKHTPNIETIYPIQTKRYDRATQTLVDSTAVVAACLPKLTKLTSMEIVSRARNASDLIDILNCVSRDNVLGSMIVRFKIFGGLIGYGQPEIAQVNFPNLTQLRFEMVTYTYGWKDNQIFDQFMLQCIPHMRNVRKLTIYGKRYAFVDHEFLLKIMQTLEQLRALDIDGRIDMTVPFYHNLVAIQQSKGHPISIKLEDTEYLSKQLGDAYNEKVVKIV